MTLTKKDLTEALQTTKKELLLETRKDLTEVLLETKKGLLLETRRDLTEALRETKKELTKDFTGALQTTKNELLEGMDQKLKVQEQYFDKKLTAQAKHFDEKLDQKLDQKVDSLRVLIEDVRADLKFSLEARDPHEEKLQNHDQILKKHETRLTTLEDYTYTKDRLK